MRKFVIGEKVKFTGFWDRDIEDTSVIVGKIIDIRGLIYKDYAVEYKVKIDDKDEERIVWLGKNNLIKIYENI